MPFDNTGGRFKPEPGIGLTDPRFYSTSTIAEGVAQPYAKVKATEITFVAYTKATPMRIT